MSKYADVLDEFEYDPNIKDLLQKAFAEVDPGPSLLQVVTEHPTYESSRFLLIVCYGQAVEEHPSRGQVLASALAKLDTLSESIFSELDWQVHFRVDFHKEDKDYGPKNKFLFHSLLSGLSLKHRLCKNSDMFAAIEQGLDPDSALGNVGFDLLPEVMVVGACIQVLLAGSMIPTAGPGYSRSAEVVAKNLRDRKAAGMVKDPHAIQVLEVSKVLHD